MKFVPSFIIVFSIMSFTSNGHLFLSKQESPCSIVNKSFKAGEKITYSVSYSLWGIYFNAGSATFTTALDSYNLVPVYHVIGTGATNRGYDWVFKVRDRYESFIDTATMQPLQFIRNVHEGKIDIYERVLFNKEDNTAFDGKKTYKVPSCIQDIMSSMYYARNIDFDKYNIGDKIYFSILLDGEIQSIYLRYLGKEVLNTRYGSYHTIKFKPLLLKGTMFQGGENMTVWITDDKNHIPLHIETPIIVGKIQVDLLNWSNTRYSVTAKIKN